MQEITIQAKDGIDLAALYWDNAADQSVLLLHMMPATKESWVELAEKLSAEDLNVLAIDFRGHGNSGGGDFKTFTPEQHYGYFKDVEAAAAFLETKYPSGVIMPGGASIGANLALWYMTKHSMNAPKGFALSAGLDYYGVRAIDFVQTLHGDQAVMLVGSHDDKQDASDNGTATEQLANAATSKKEKIIFDAGGHGTNLFASHPELIDRIVTFFTS